MSEKDKPKFDSMTTTKQSQTVLVNKNLSERLFVQESSRQPTAPGLETNPRIREKSNCYRNHTSLQNCLHSSMDAFATANGSVQGDWVTMAVPALSSISQKPA